MSSLRKLCFSLNSEDFLLYKVSHLEILHLSAHPLKLVFVQTYIILLWYITVCFTDPTFYKQKVCGNSAIFSRESSAKSWIMCEGRKKEYFQSHRSLCWEDPLEKEMATHSLVFLPGESHRQRSLVGYSPWSHKELDTTEWLNKNNNNNNKKKQKQKKHHIQKLHLQWILFWGKITSRKYVPPKRWTRNKIVDPENGRSKGGGVWKESSGSQ